MKFYTFICLYMCMGIHAFTNVAFVCGCVCTWMQVMCMYVWMYAYAAGMFAVRERYTCLSVSHKECMLCCGVICDVLFYMSVGMLEHSCVFWSKNGKCSEAFWKRCWFICVRSEVAMLSLLICCMSTEYMRKIEGRRKIGRQSRKDTSDSRRVCVFFFLQ